MRLEAYAIHLQHLQDLGLDEAHSWFQGSYNPIHLHHAFYMVGEPLLSDGRKYRRLPAVQQPTRAL